MKTLTEAIGALAKGWPAAGRRFGALLLMLCACAALGQGLNPGGPIDFGTINVGAAPPKTYTLTFSASVPTNIQSVAALTEGVANLDFSVISQTCTGPQAPPQSCTVEIGFSPTVPGLRRGALTVTDSTGAVVNRIYLHGIGTGAQLVTMPPAPALLTSVGLSPASFSASGVAVDASGAAYFNDVTYGRILKRDSTGRVTQLALLPTNANTAIAIDGAGTLYITSGATVYAMTQSNGPVPLSTGSNALVDARGVAVDGAGYVYIADAQQNRIVRVGPDGSSAVLAISGLPSPLAQPSGLAIDASNNLYIADTGNNRIVVMGLYMGSASVITAGLSSPTGVAVDASGSLVVADTGNRRVMVLPVTGTPFAMTTPGVALHTPTGIAIGDNADLVLADPQLGLLLLARHNGTLSFPTSTHVLQPDTLDGVLPFEVLNSGNVALQLTVPASGTNPSLTTSAYAISNTSTCPQLTPSSPADNTTQLAVGQACSYGVTFTPQVPGANADTATVSATAVGGATALTGVVNLSGTGVSNTVSFTVTATPTMTQPGSGVSYTVTAMDTNGNVDTTYRGTVAFTATDSAATFPAGKTYTFTAADAGVHIFSAPVAGVVFNTLGTFTITAKDSTASGTSNAVQVVLANGFALTASPDTITTGGNVALTVTATFNGVPVPNYTGTVTLSATDSTARFLSGTSYTFTAADKGTHTFPLASGVQFNTMGTYTIGATDGTYSGTSNTVQVVNADGFTVTATPSATTIGAPVSFTVSATFHGSPAPSFTGTVTFATQDPAAKFLSGATYTFTAADRGTHTFTAPGGAQFNTPGTYTIVATAGVLTGTSNTVTVQGITGFTITASPSTLPAGASAGFTISATNNGTIIPGYQGTVTFSATDPAARFLGVTSYTFTAADAGTHTFSQFPGVQFNTPGTWVIKATDGTYSGTSNSVTVLGATGFAITAAPSTLPVGGSAGFSLSATNNGTVIPNYTGTVTLSATDPAAKFLGATSYTFTTADGGTHFFPAASGVQFNTAGTWNIKATDGTLNGTSNNVQVVAATGFTVTATPSSTTVGTPVSFTVTAVNNGATAASFTGQVVFSTNDPAARFLSGVTYTFTSADNGTHTFTAPASGVQFNTGGTFTVTATAGALTGVSNPVQVIAPNALTIVASPTVTSQGVPVSFTVSATSNGVVIPGYMGTVLFSSTDPAAKFLAGMSYMFTASDKGTHTFAAPAAGVQLNTLGTWTVSATDGALSGISNSVQVVGVTGFSVVATPASTSVGTPVSFTVTALQSGATATAFTGPVTFSTSDPRAKFLAGATYTFTAADNGIHTFTAPAAGVQFNSVGTFTVTASEGGVTGTSNGVTVGSNAAVTLTSSANPVLVGTQVTMSATVAGVGGTPTGTVVFLDGTTPLQTVPLVNGTATASVAFSGAGTHSLTAAYSGDVSFPATVSAVLAETVEDFSLTLAPNSSSSASVLAGHAATYSLVLSPVGAATLPAAVTLTASGAPAGAKVTLTPASVAAGSGATPITLSITPALVTGAAREHAVPGSSRGRAAAVTLALMFLPIAGFVRRRRLVARLLVLALAVLPLTALTGCLSASQDGYYGSAPQHYTVIVTATSGSVTRTYDVTLTVQ